MPSLGGRHQPEGAVPRRPWTALLAGAAAVLLLATPSAGGETERIALVLRDGLLYVPVRLVGCVQDPDLELLLDTGSAVTVLPHPHMQRLCGRRRALPIGDVSVELVDGGATQAMHFLVEGLRIGSCELPAVRALACPSERSHWRLVLGMDVLERLREARIELRQDGGDLVFSCPPKPTDPTADCLAR